MGYRPTVLSVKPKNEHYEIKTIFSDCTEQGYSNPLCVMNIYAKKENNEYKLFNALLVNRKNWKTKKAGSVTYYYPLEHSFDIEKATRMNDFIDSITNVFNLKVVQIDFYLANDFDEIQKLRGFDYYMGMGNAPKTTGRADILNKIVYSGGRSEYYPHEVVHIYINPIFPNAHNWFSEGIATYLGGSRGYSLQWHVDRTSKYLKDHPEIDLNNVLEYGNLDQYTHYAYVIGGLLCDMAYQNGGWELVKKLLDSGKTKDNFYDTIDNVLEINKKNLNEVLRRELKNRTSKK